MLIWGHNTAIFYADIPKYHSFDSDQTRDTANKVSVPRSDYSGAAGLTSSVKRSSYRDVKVSTSPVSVDPASPPRSHHKSPQLPLSPAASTFAKSIQRNQRQQQKVGGSLAVPIQTTAAASSNTSSPAHLAKNIADVIGSPLTTKPLV